MDASGRALACFIDAGQQVNRPLADHIDRGCGCIRLGQNKSGQHQIGKCAGHHKTTVIGTRVKENAPIQSRVRQRTIFIADDGQLQNAWLEGANSLDNSSTLRTVAGSGQGDHNIHAEQVAFRVDQQIRGRDGKGLRPRCGDGACGVG